MIHQTCSFYFILNEKYKPINIISKVAIYKTKNPKKINLGSLNSDPPTILIKNENIQNSSEYIKKIKKLLKLIIIINSNIIKITKNKYSHILNKLQIYSIFFKIV